MFENRVYLHVTHQSMQVMRSAYKLGIKHPGIDALMTKQTKTIAMNFVPMRTTLLMTTPINAHQDDKEPRNTEVLALGAETLIQTASLHSTLYSILPRRSEFFHCVFFMQFFQHQYSFNFFVFDHNKFIHPCIHVYTTLLK